MAKAAGTRRKERRASSDTREHVLDVAHDLFYWTGIRATGVDRVAAEAGIAPTALYRLFPSKDALVAAYVERAAGRYREWFDEATRADGRPAALRVVALFGALAERVKPEVCRGCPFIMAVTEFPEDEAECHRAAVRLKEWVRGRFRSLAAEVAAEAPHRHFEPASLADHLTLLFEGVYATVPTLGASGPARGARDFAAALVGVGPPSRRRGRARTHPDAL
ncbi:MAG TPA: TetR/AcrR family transcriptional regulator [Polyangiaceae bacterium]